MFYVPSLTCVMTGKDSYMYLNKQQEVALHCSFQLKNLNSQQSKPVSHNLTSPWVVIQDFLKKEIPQGLFYFPTARRLRITDT